MQQKNKYPEVSICIATYNSKDMLRRLLKSIEIQTFKDYEVIVCDDSDNNESELICKRIIGVKYYHNEIRLGATPNNNRAISLAKGKYVKVMHHDDYFTDKNSLQQYVDLFNDSKFHGNFVFSGRYDEQSDGSLLACHTSKFDLYRIRKNWKNILFGAVIGAPSVTMWRNQIDKPFLFDSNIAWFVDLESYCRMLNACSEFKYCSNPLVVIGRGYDEVKMTNVYRSDYNLIIYEGLYIYKKMGSDNRRFLVQLLSSKYAPMELLKKYHIGRIEICFWKIINKTVTILNRIIIYYENHLSEY